MKFYTFAIAVAATIVVLAATETSASCKDEWKWENCSELYYRYECSDGSDDHLEGYTDCGWVYYDEDLYEEWWVTCDEFKSWEYCQ